MRSEEAGALRPGTDAQAHEWAMSASIQEVVSQLCAMLGAPAVAAVGGVGETRAVAQWMSGRAPQRPHVLRFALQIALMISHPDDGEVARAWFNGSNPHLNDEVPITLLRTRPLHEVQAALLAAARSFSTRRRAE